MMLKIILLVAIASVHSPCKRCVSRLLSSTISTCRSWDSELSTSPPGQRIRSPSRPRYTQPTLRYRERSTWRLSLGPGGFVVLICYGYDLIWIYVVLYEIGGSQVPSLLDLKELNRNLRWLAVAVVLTWTFCISLGQDSGSGAAAGPNIWERWNFNSISILSLNKMYYFESYNIRQLHKLSNL